MTWPGFARVALLMTAVALTGSTLALAIAQETRQGGPPNLGPSVARILDARFTNTAEQQACEGDTAQVYLVLEEIDAAKLTMTVNADLCVSGGLMNRLVDTGRHNEPATHGSRYVPHLEPRFTNTHIGVLFRGVDPEDSLDVDQIRETTLRHLVVGQPNKVAGQVPEPLPVVHLGRFVVPIVAAPERYPFDWYAFVGDFRVSLIGGDLALAQNHRGAPPYAGDLPLQVVVLRDPDISPSAMQTGVAEESVAGEYVVRVGMSLGRSATARWYVVIVALIPLLLALLLCVALFGPARAPNQLGAEAVAGVTAALLAILPIRLVLVPASASDLTAVDYLLGFEMAVLAAIACLAVRHNLCKQAEPPQ